MVDLDEELQDYRDEPEGCGAQNAADNVWIGEAVRLRRPDEDKIGESDDRNSGFRIGEVEFVSVNDGAGNRGGDQSDDDEERAGNTRIGFAVAVGLKDLVEEAGERVEKTNVDGEGNE